MKKKILLLSLIIISILTLPGCWDYVEYENMVQVIAYGIDYNVDSNEITATIQYIPTTEEGSQSTSLQNGVLLSATGHTLYDAISRLREGSFKELFWGYLKVVVISEDAIKYKTKDIIENFNRTPVIRDSTYLVISPGKAEDTINTSDSDAIASSGEIIYDLLELSTDISTAFPVTIQEFTTMLATPGLEAVAPRVLTTNPKLQSQDNEAAQRVSGIAAFNKDKFVGWLDEKESSGFSWITEREASDYKIADSSEEADTSDILYFKVDKSKSKINAQIVNGKPVIKIEVKVYGELRKYYSNNGSSILLPKDIDLMEKKFSESIRSDIEAALKKSQRELRSDIFGFGFAFYRKHTKLWQTELERNWSDIYPNMEVNITVNAKVENTNKNLRKFIVK